MIKYKVGEEYLDQFDRGGSFAITKAVSKIGEINLRHGDRSTSFKVPLTAKNTRILNYITNLSTNKASSAFKKIVGRLVEEETTISEGYFQVIKFDYYKKEIDLRFYGGNTDWFSDIKKKKINESDKPGEGNYNVEDIGSISISSGTIVDTFSTELSESNPFKFFLVDNNIDTTRNNTNETVLNTYFSDYQLGVSQGVIFDRIMKSIDVNTDGNMFDDPKYYNTLISASNDMGAVERDQEEPFFIAKITPNTTQVISSSGGVSYSEIAYNTTDPSEEFDGRKFTFKGNASGIDFTVFSPILFIYGLGEGGTKKLYYRFVRNKGQSNESILDNGVVNLNQEVDIPGGVGQPPLSYYYGGGDIFLDGENIAFSEGETISIEYSTDVTDIYGGDPIVGDFSNETGQDQAEVWYKIYGYTKSTTAKSLIPDIDQSAFVKDVLVQFGAITQYDQKTRTLTCNKFDLIDDRRSFAIDWSKKIDLSKNPQVNLTTVLKDYGKRSFFKYEEADESDVLNNLYRAITNYQIGDGAIIVDNDFIQDDKDVYQSPYASTITVGTFPFSDDDENNRANFFLPFVPLFTRTSDTDLESNDLAPRKYLHLGNVNIASSYKGNATSAKLGSGAGGINTFTEMPLVYFDKTNYPYNFQSPLNDIKETLSFGVLQDLTVNTRTDDLLKSLNFSTSNNNNTILNNYYNFQKKILDKPVYLEIYLRLSPLDVQNVDFFTPIFLDFDLDSGYYYIDEISQYKGQDQSTKVKLVKI